MQGRVKWFDKNKGYGFIESEERGSDVFVHISAVEKAGLRGLNEGDQVSFNLVDNRGRKAAADLAVL